MKNKFFKNVLIFFVVIIFLSGIYLYFFLKSRVNFLGEANKDNEKNQVVTSENETEIENMTTEKKYDLNKLENKTLKVSQKFKEGVFEKDRSLNLPQGFEISVFQAGLNKPRFFDFDENNSLIVAEIGSNKIVMLKDEDRDGTSDKRIEIDSGLNKPHSVFYYDGDLFIAEEDKVSVYRNLGDNGDYTQKDILIDDLPVNAGHYTRTVVIGPDHKLYVSVGSSCNVCEEFDRDRAAILQYNIDGSGKDYYAKGLRNTVGFTFGIDPETGQEIIWSADNGRDNLGDDLPGEEINKIIEDGNYGWPYCYDDGINNPEFKDRVEFCKKETIAPFKSIQAHSAPLGVAFIPDEFLGEVYPKEMISHLFIAFHGSWNRTAPTGYKVVYMNVTDSGDEVRDFITGWLMEDGKAWGRPVGIGFDEDGVMYISDDEAGAIYRVTLN